MPTDGLQIVYIVDTSVLVNIRDVYGDSEEIWAKLIEEIQAGNVKIVRQVFDELQRRFPDVFVRLKVHKKDAQVLARIIHDGHRIWSGRAVSAGLTAVFRGGFS